MPTLQELLLSKGMDAVAAGAKQGGDAVGTLRALLTSKQADMAKQTAEQQFEAPFKERAASVAEQNARTMEGYRKDQAHNYEEQRRVDKLKLLMGGGAGGVGPDGKPLSNEAQKTSNLVDSAREALNKTEDLSKQHPYVAAAQTGLQTLPWGSNIANSVAGLVGGSFKELNDSKGITKEAMQNVDTGAAATGDQSSTFKNWSGPGVMDIFSGNAANSEGVRDKLNTMQTGYNRQAKTLTPEMLQAAEMDDDPIAQQAMAQQETRGQQKLQEKLQKLSPQDQEAYKWLQANPGDPAAPHIQLKLKRRYGNLF
jgi:hypothetical protein